MGRRAGGRDLAEVTWANVHAFRLQRHHLRQRARLRDLRGVTHGIGGAQAQVVSAAGLALAARVEGFDQTALDRSLTRPGGLVRAWCMRRTLHLVPARSLALYVRGTTCRAERETRWVLARGMARATLDRWMAVLLDGLESPRTVPELAPLVARGLGGRVIAKAGGGWGSARRVLWVRAGTHDLPVNFLLHLVGAYGVVCNAASREGQPAYVRGDRWVPHFRDQDPDVAARELLRTYLRAYGPATPRDFAFWTGIRLRDVARIWAAIQDELVWARVEGEPAALLRRDLSPLQRSSPPAEDLRLLPYFDAYVLGHRERDHLLAAHRLARLSRPQGWISPVVLRAGRIGGTWTYRMERGGLRVVVQPFERLRTGDLDQLREEAGGVARYFGVELADLRTVQ